MPGVGDSDSEGNLDSGGLDSTPLPLTITTDLSFDMRLPEATDAAQNQSSWRLMALYCTTHPEWCTTICDWIHATGPEYINIQPYTVNITVYASLLGPTRPAMVTQARQAHHCRQHDESTEVQRQQNKLCHKTHNACLMCCLKFQANQSTEYSNKYSNRACKLLNIRLYATLCFNYFR